MKGVDKMKFDVVIIGGGPAGLSAGFALAETGTSVAIIEKNYYPREKTCAGILTQKTACFLKDKIPQLDIMHFFTTNQLSLFYKDERTIHVPVNYPFILVDRKQFDYKLFNICKASNVHIIEGKKVSAINPDKNILYLNSGETVLYDFLVAADGSHSITRKSLGLQGMPLAFCIQDSIERCLCPDSLAHLQELQLHFGNLSFGYSWVVPNNECIVIGTGVFENKFAWSKLQEQHNKLCSKYFLPEISKRRGAHVPIGGLIDQTSYPNENIIFIGDAAGLANPLTGEGIYYALLSGFLASEAYINNRIQFKTTYLSLLHNILDNLKQDRYLLASFYDCYMLENIFFQLKDYPEYFSDICDEVVSLEQRSYLTLIEELNGLFR